MNYIATITSKRQFTIPAALFKEANLKTNQKVLVRLVSADGVLRVEPMKRIVDQLAGSVKVPSQYKGMNIDEMIEKAKLEYFSKKR